MKRQEVIKEAAELTGMSVVIALIIGIRILMCGI